MAATAHCWKGTPPWANVQCQPASISQHPKTCREPTQDSQPGETGPGHPWTQRAWNPCSQTTAEPPPRQTSQVGANMHPIQDRSGQELKGTHPGSYHTQHRTTEADKDVSSARHLAVSQAHQQRHSDQGAACSRSPQQHAKPAAELLSKSSSATSGALLQQNIVGVVLEEEKSR